MRTDTPPDAFAEALDRLEEPPIHALDGPDGAIEFVAVLRGVHVNPDPADDRRSFEARVERLVDRGFSPLDATNEALVERREELGIAPEHGHYGEQVSPWWPGNLAVLVAPLSERQEAAFVERTGRSLAVAVLELCRDALEGQAFGEVGLVPEEVQRRAREVCAFLLSANGRVLGRDYGDGTLRTEPIALEEVLPLVPERVVDPSVVGSRFLMALLEACGLPAFDLALEIRRAVAAENAECERARSASG